MPLKHPTTHFSLHRNACVGTQWPCLYNRALQATEKWCAAQAAAYTAILQPAAQQAPLRPAPACSPSAAAEQYYAAALPSIAATARHSVTPANRRKRDQTLQALAAFLSGPLAGLGRNLLNCTDLDILVFITQHYIPQHSGSQLPDGSVRMAPGSVSNVLSALAMGLDELGRSGTANPARSPRVSCWRRGYTKESTAALFKATGAQACPCSLHATCEPQVLLLVLQLCLQPVSLAARPAL